VVSARAARFGRGASQALPVTIAPKQDAHLDIDIPVGTVTVTATATGAAGMVQLVLASGTIAAAHADQLFDALAARGAGATHNGFSVHASAVTFPDVVPGGYSACAVAFPPTVQSPRDAAQLRDQLDQLPCACTPVTIGDGPTQTIAVPVPPS
jgi:hypothetical protein